MSQNPVYHQTELAASQSQPEVPVNFADRIISYAQAGQKTIDMPSDADYELVASDPAVASDDWFWSWIVITDTGPVLTTGRNIVFPDVDALGGGGPTRHRFIFTNDTAETLTVLMNATGSSGVAVTTGQTVKLRVNQDGDDIEADS